MLKSGTAAIFDGAKLGYWTISIPSIGYHFNDMNLGPVYVREDALSAIQAYSGKKSKVIFLKISSNLFGMKFQFIKKVT